MNFCSRGVRQAAEEWPGPQKYNFALICRIPWLLDWMQISVSYGCSYRGIDSIKALSVACVARTAAHSSRLSLCAASVPLASLPNSGRLPSNSFSSVGQGMVQK